MTQFYAYVHARPATTDAAGIFYVGKGTARRTKAIVHQKRSAHHQNIVNKYGRENILVGRLACSSEDIAFELEKGLIKCLRRMNVALVNRTAGGDGALSAEAIERIRAAKLGSKHSEETKKKMSLAQTVRMNKPEEKLRAAESMRRRMQDYSARKELSLKTRQQWVRQRSNTASQDAFVVQPQPVMDDTARKDGVNS